MRGQTRYDWLARAREANLQEPNLIDEFRAPSQPFLRGIARLFDFTGNLDRPYRDSVTAFFERERRAIEAESAKFAEEVAKPGHLRDAEAIASDWKRVGDGLRWALNEHKT